MHKTTFKVNKMDCPSEEQMIRMKLDDVPGVNQLQFDIPRRTLIVYHDNFGSEIEQSISELNLDSSIIESVSEVKLSSIQKDRSEKSILIAVLLINFVLFLVELITGFISYSMGLVADSLDMFADSIVYGLSLYAIGHSVARKKKIAKIAGIFQFVLAIIGFSEVIRRFLGFEAIPIFETMIVISLLALAGNIASLLILHKAKDSGAHMKASWIFTSNDIIANLGVILAGVLVFITSSSIPDLLVGTVVFGLVARGAIRIYKLSK